MLEEHLGKLEQLHKPVQEQGHKQELAEVLAYRLVLVQGQACRWAAELGHIEEQQRPKPGGKTKQ